MAMGGVQELVIPKDLQGFLKDVVDGRSGYRLGEPWKFSDKALAVVVPIIRERAPERLYVTMYEVLKELGMRDTGHIDKVELQNRAGKPVFVRAGTIFEGQTQNRAAEHSGVVQPGKEDIPVRCVHQTHGISRGAQMKFGDIAPMSVTRTLLGDYGQSAVWNAVHCFASMSMGEEQSSQRRGSSWSVPERPVSYQRSRGSSAEGHGMWDESVHGTSCFTEVSSPFIGFMSTSRGDDLLGTMRAVDKGKVALDEMMQKVPLFPEQVGAVIFDPVGVQALESFDHPKSWEAIKKEVIERYGDRVSQEQAENLFELKQERIVPMLKKFVQGLDKFEEKRIRGDEFSETRAVKGEGVVGEYTLIRNRVMHCILVRAG